MTAMMNPTDSYLDFFDIAVDAYTSKKNGRLQEDHDHLDRRLQKTAS